jgi:hypothetical protein
MLERPVYSDLPTGTDPLRDDLLGLTVAMAVLDAVSDISNSLGTGLIENAGIANALAAAKIKAASRGRKRLVSAK